MAFNNTGRKDTTNISNKTEYRVYCDSESMDVLRDKVFGLFVQAFINTELDTMTKQRDNTDSIKKNSNKEDKQL